jgi:hypothetical protein
MENASNKRRTKAQATKNPKRIKEVLTHNGLPHVFDFTFHL